MSEVTLGINLTPAQIVVHSDDSRFIVLTAGRRFGKTVYAVIRCLLEGMASRNARVPLDRTSEVVYFGPDREQAK